MGRLSGLTKEQKLAIFRQSEKKPEWNQKQLGQWAAKTFELRNVPSQSSISVALRQAGKERSPNTKRPSVLVKSKVTKFPQLENEMVQWLEIQIINDTAISVAKVHEKAEEVLHQMKDSADGFVLSDAWIDTFIRRHMLNCPYEESDVETTDCDERQEPVKVRHAAVSKSLKNGKAGKTTRRLTKELVATRTPMAMHNDARIVGKRKRDHEQANQ
ncbi:uncharacterized protein CCR75_001173 [Bremia lactucae]|uniref:HTH CENPB-type domain-containing protein n=1 Tax=Bremia lactucae TaxID=4779 RepID=A0A976NZU4_BRELC|nr:hypothetical protein CCR75_001173 [Bremia lactucae]